MATYGGWTGKTLRVNLSTGKISTEDTVGKYKDYLGGTGAGYRILWDEVPAGTKAFDEANKIVLGVGPLTGTSAPSSGRTSVVTVFPLSYPVELPAAGHMGGQWGNELKYAGWDNVIIEGKSEKPVYIAIVNEKVEIRDASHLWGHGIYHTTTSICQEMGPETQVAAIGQAGENLVRLSVLNNAYSHSAGGVGGVFGSKKLKAIAVRGTGSIKIAADKQDWKKLVLYTLSTMGANNNHVVPSTRQPWAEYFSPRTRWTAQKGLFWGAANPPVETGECNPEDLNSIGLRSDMAVYWLGRVAEKNTVRSSGCACCPVQCFTSLDVPQVEEKYGVSRYSDSTCTRINAHDFIESYPGGLQGQAILEGKALGIHLVDDYGIFTHYHQLARDFNYAYTTGLIKANLSAEEYKSIPWDKREKGDPAFLIEIYRRIAYREGELGIALGEGTCRMAERWKFPKSYFDEGRSGLFKMGQVRHHGNEVAWQVGVLINTYFNINIMSHSHTNFITNGLPTQVQKEIAAKLWGSDAIDPPANYTRMNPAKAKFAAWSILRNELHDSLTLCNWMYPLVASPLKSRNYEGDNTIEAQLYSLVTGDKKDVKELDLVAERIVNLQRALTMRDMGTADMRSKHDTIPGYVFDEPADGRAFTPGQIKMDRDDMELAKDMFYETLGWDKKTGSPKRATLERVGLKDVADKLAQMGLLPA